MCYCVDMDMKNIAIGAGIGYLIGVIFRVPLALLAMLLFFLFIMSFTCPNFRPPKHQMTPDETQTEINRLKIEIEETRRYNEEIRGATELLKTERLAKQKIRNARKNGTSTSETKPEKSRGRRRRTPRPQENNETSIPRRNP